MQEDKQPGRRISNGAIAGISAAVLAAGGAGAWWALNSGQPATQAPPVTTTTPQPAPTTATQPVPTTTTQPVPTATTPITTASQAPQPTQSLPPAAEKTVQVYWLKNTGTSIEVVPSSIQLQKANSKPSVLLGDAFNTLLAGPTDANLTSTIPSGTKLRSVDVREDGIHVNLSQEFTTGGGTTSMTGRVAQVLYTATSLNPDAKVWIDVEGKKLEILGGEGLELDQPLTRKKFEADYQL